MRALARLTSQNVRTKVHKIQAGLKKDDSLNILLKGVAMDMSEGYPDVLTPNGIVRDDKLDTLLSLDSDIVMCLEIIATKDRQKEAEDVLKGLVEERKKFVAALRA